MLKRLGARVSKTVPHLDVLVMAELAGAGCLVAAAWLWGGLVLGLASLGAVLVLVANARA
jgi:hypothetical protein